MRVLIAGGGDVGSLIAQRLIREGNEVAIVEQDQDRCAHLEDTLDAKIIEGSATRVRDLEKAGLQHSDMLIAVTNADETNLLACLVAQTKSRVRVKVARMRSHEVDQWRQICKDANIQIDLMIHPESEATARILPVLHLPGVSDIVDFAGGRVKLFGMNIDMDSWLAGQTVREIVHHGPPKHTLLAMIFRGQQVIIPHGGEMLLPNDHIYVITRDVDLKAVHHFMGLPAPESLQRTFILGGKQIGIRVAGELERAGVGVKLFEDDARRCERVSELLENTVVIHGDGKDAVTLTEQGVQGVGAYLALTNDDEDNLIAALLARRLGAKKVVALINRLNYLAMARRLGIHTSVSPRLVTVDRILQYVRKGRVMSVTTFGEEAAEAIELSASADSRYVGKKMKDIRLPSEVIVGAIIRPDGEVIMPRGNDFITPGDRVIFFTVEGVVSHLEKAFLAETQRGTR